MGDPYRILGVSSRAGERQITAAFRRLAKRLHPDVNPGDRAAEQRFKDVTRAYETLRDPEARALYDDVRRRRRATARRDLARVVATGMTSFLLTVVLTVGLTPFVRHWWQAAQPARIDAETTDARAVAEASPPMVKSPF